MKRFWWFFSGVKRLWWFFSRRNDRFSCYKPRFDETRFSLIPDFEQLKTSLKRLFGIHFFGKSLENRIYSINCYFLLKPEKILKNWRLWSSSGHNAESISSSSNHNTSHFNWSSKRNAHTKKIIKVSSPRKQIIKISSCLLKSSVTKRRLPPPPQADNLLVLADWGFSWGGSKSDQI